jgi:hypothetical protein
LDGFLGLEPRGVVIALADGLCDLRGEITSAEGLRDWGHGVPDKIRGVINKVV